MCCIRLPYVWQRLTLAGRSILQNATAFVNSACRFPAPHMEIPRPFSDRGISVGEKKRQKLFSCHEAGMEGHQQTAGGHGSTGRAAAGTDLTGRGAPPLGVGFGVLYHAARQIAICNSHIAQIFFAVFLLPPSRPNIILPLRSAPTKSPRRRRWRRCRTRSPAPPR